MSVSCCGSHCPLTIGLIKKIENSNICGYILLGRYTNQNQIEYYVEIKNNTLKDNINILDPSQTIDIPKSYMNKNASSKYIWIQEKDLSKLFT